MRMLLKGAAATTTTATAAHLVGPRTTRTRKRVRLCHSHTLSLAKSVSNKRKQGLLAGDDWRLHFWLFACAKVSHRCCVSLFQLSHGWGFCGEKILFPPFPRCFDDRDATINGTQHTQSWRDRCCYKRACHHTEVLFCRDFWELSLDSSKIKLHINCKCCC
jgi:hypothetical protein